MKTYGLIFTNEDPRSAPSASLAPTLVTFFQIGGSTLAAPGITKPIPTVGLYTFTYDPGLTLPIYFLADGGALVTDNSQRYLSGMLDPIQQVDQQAQTLTAIGNSNIALGTTNFALGTSNIALGNSNIALGVTNVAIGTSITAQAVTLTAYSVSIFAGLLGYSASIEEILTRMGQTTSPIGSTSIDPSTLFGYLKRLQEFNEGNQSFNKTSGVWEIASRGDTLLATKTLTNTSAQVTKT